MNRRESVIRVLHIVGAMNQGGIETLIMDLYRCTDRTQIQFDFLVHDFQRGYFDDEIEAFGGTIHRLENPFSLLGALGYRRNLNKFFSVHCEYTILHSHLNTFSGVVLDVAKRVGIKTRIAHSHAASPGSILKLPLSLVGRMLGRSAITHFFACSTKAANWAFGHYGDSAIIVRNGIDTDRFVFSEENRAEYRRQLKLNNELVIGHIGRFTKDKDHNYLIDIFSEVIKLDSNVQLLLIGEGPLEKSIRNKISNLNIQDSVELLGRRDDVAQLLSAMDVFVFPSENEGLGIAAIEAQANGLICIASDTLPKELQQTDSIKFLSKNKGAAYWANTVVNGDRSLENRKEGAFKIKQKGYDIKNIVVWLSEFYIKQSHIENKYP